MLPPVMLEKGILLRLRFEFHQYVNLRPVRLYPGRGDAHQGERARPTSTWSSSARTTRTSTSARGASPAKGPPRKSRSRPRSTRAGVLNAVSALRLRPGDRQRGLASGPYARPRRWPTAVHGVDRAGYAWSPRPTCLTFAHDLWMRTFTEVSRDYREIKADYQHVDACCMRLVTNPERFDVIATTNMFGDIITDLGRGASRGGWVWPPRRNLNPAPDGAQHVRARARLGPRHRRPRESPIPIAAILSGGHDARPPGRPPQPPKGSAAPRPACSCRPQHVQDPRPGRNVRPRPKSAVLILRGPRIGGQGLRRSRDEPRETIDSPQ